MVRPLNLRAQSELPCLVIDAFPDDVSLVQDTHFAAPWDSVPIPCDWSLAKYKKRAVCSMVVVGTFVSQVLAAIAEIL